MTYSFNLIEEPWIPCITVDDEYVELCLYDLFAHSHQLREIQGETPIVTAAILPMLLAVLHRIYGPDGYRTWQRLWKQGEFPMEPIKHYLDQWHDRFDLFHPEYPFYQQRDERVDTKSVLYLAQPIAANPTLFEHRTETDNVACSPAEATRMLLSAQAFRLGGGISGKETRNFIGSVLVRGILFFANGNTLFETLMLNLIRYDDENPMLSTPADKPVWELDTPFDHRGFSKNQVSSVPEGYLDYLTWQTNHIYLVPETLNGQTVVKEFGIAPIMKLDDAVKCPQKQYRAVEKKDEVSWYVLDFNPSKALWRDFHSFLYLEDGKFEQPKVIEWFESLIGNDVFDEDAVLPLMAIGGRTEDGKPGKQWFYRQEQLSIHASLLRDVDKQNLIQLAINLAEDVAYRLNETVRELATEVLMRGSELKPDTANVTALVTQWDIQSMYFADLEPLFWQFIDQLVRDEPDLLDWWKDILRQTARDKFAEACRLSGSGAGALKGQVKAEAKLNGWLKKTLE